MINEAPLEDLLVRLDALQGQEIAPAAREHAARVLADTVGVIMAGHLQPEMKAFASSQATSFGQPAGDARATMLAPGLPRTASAPAALINGTAGVFLELDEGSRPTGHPAVHIVPAALATAEEIGASGEELITALILGYEVTVRLFHAYRLRFPLHCHGHLPAIGAAVAVARLRGRSVVEPGLVAASLPLLSVWQPCFEGATVRNTWSGFGAMIGVLANTLVDSGFTGSRTAFPAAFGELVGDLVDPEMVSAPVDGSSMLIERNYFKLHSCCASSHAAVDVVLGLELPAGQEISAIEVETVTSNLKIDRQALDSSLSRRFSFPYAVAAAAIHGHAGPTAFAPDQRVSRLAERVTVRSDSDLDSQWPEASPARVTVKLDDRTIDGETENPCGHWRNPASAEQLRDKFEGLAWVAGPGALYEAILAADSSSPIGSLFAGLRENAATAQAVHGGAQS